MHKEWLLYGNGKGSKVFYETVFIITVIGYTSRGDHCDLEVVSLIIGRATLHETYLLPDELKLANMVHVGRKVGCVVSTFYQGFRQCKNLLLSC